VRPYASALIAVVLAGGGVRADAQASPPPDSALRGFPTADSVIRRIYDEGMQHSQVAALAQILMDSIGPRLVGSPANRAANDWLLRTYAGWGIAAHNEQYGTWLRWARGPSQVVLLAPRTRVLEATQLPWSPRTPAEGITGDLVLLPRAEEAGDSAGFARWLAGVKGKFVLLDYPQPTCRPDPSWKAWASAESYAAMRAARDAGAAEWQRRLAVAGSRATLDARLKSAGAAGVLLSEWSGGWGANKVQWVDLYSIPVFTLNCEDYALVARLAAHGQHPRAHAVAQSEVTPGESPVFNTIAELPGTEHPDQYVLLSAHFDSWDGGSGATDNGNGTITMLEAMRLLRLAIPHPKRTILVGHWNGEEVGEVGSNAFAIDHPAVLAGLQAVLNEDDGPGKIDTVGTGGFLGAPSAFARWLAQMPDDISAGVAITEPGIAASVGSDADGFGCRGTPGFELAAGDWDHEHYTWHSRLDTYDKLDFDAVKRNATLIAMLAYEAAQDPEQMSRARRIPPTDPRTGQAMDPPQCWPVMRSWGALVARLKSP
jgi:carboxypeptidase Q